jgi:predicted anti-sigma-YlaC factor YlaD
VTCDEARLSLGAYALGSLDEDEDAHVRAHVEDCADCRDEIHDLEGLPALLADLTIEEASGQVQPSPALYESLRARVEAEREPRRPARRHLVLAAAAGVAVLTLAGGAFAWQEMRGETPSSSGSTFSSSQGSAHLTVELNTRTTGTGLTVRVGGLPANEHCTLIAVGPDGKREVAGSWVATYEGEATVNGWTAFTIPQLTQVLVVDEQGHTLVGTSV